MGTVQGFYGKPPRIRFRFTPDEKTGLVCFKFGLKQSQLKDNFQALGISALPELPSHYLWFDQGQAAAAFAIMAATGV